MFFRPNLDGRTQEFTASGQAFACPSGLPAAHPSREPRGGDSEFFLSTCANSGWSFQPEAPTFSMTWATVEALGIAITFLLANAPVQRNLSFTFGGGLSNSTENSLESTALIFARARRKRAVCNNRDSVLLQYSSSPPSMVLSIRL